MRSCSRSAIWYTRRGNYIRILVIDFVPHAYAPLSRTRFSFLCTRANNASHNNVFELPIMNAVVYQMGLHHKQTVLRINSIV